MTFKKAVKRLDIEDYEERIFKSNSHGELFHLLDYIVFAKTIKGDASWFRPLFIACVKYAEKNWKRPESCFQHIPKRMVALCSK